MSSEYETPPAPAPESGSDYYPPPPPDDTPQPAARGVAPSAYPPPYITNPSAVSQPPQPGPVNGSLHLPPPAVGPPPSPNKSTQVPLIAGLCVSLVLLAVVVVWAFLWYFDKKRKKASPSAKSDGEAVSGSYGLFSPFPCCPIIIQLAQASPQHILHQQPGSLPKGAPAADNEKPSMSPMHKDEVHGEKDQDFSPLHAATRPLMLVDVRPSPTCHPTTNKHLNSNTCMDIQPVCKVFSYMELEVATNSFREENFLGEGGYGYVHKGLLPNLKEIAVKQLSLDSKQGDREFKAEVETIGRVHHRNLVSLVGYCIHKKNRLLVYEFIPNKTLDFHLHGEGQPIIPWSTRVKIALGSAKGITYLHEECLPKIIHRDIKASNILVDYNYEAKVADFGLAKFSPDDKTHVSTRIMGTFGYLAPEYANSGKITEKSDIYSFGVILVELITGRQPSTPIVNGLVSWVRPLMLQSLRDGKFDTFVDPKLKHNYNDDEMKCMITCAITCTKFYSQERPKMSQVVRVLEGVVPMDSLYQEKSNVGEYDNASPKATIPSRQEQSSTEYNTSSEYGLNHPSSHTGGR